jgi:hypothetical protein
MSSKLTGPMRASMTIHFRTAGLLSSGRVHIVPSRGKWVVKLEGSKRARSVRSTRSGALRYAKTISKSQTIIVHKEDGTIDLKV